MRIAFAAAILAATLGTAPAAAQFYPPPFAEDPRGAEDIGWQLDEIYETIERGRRSGRFSEPEASALHREGQRLFDQYDLMRRRGLDRWEYRELEDGVRALRDRIERRLRYGDWRDRRDDGFRNDGRWGRGESVEEDWPGEEDRRKEDWRDEPSDALDYDWPAEPRRDPSDRDAASEGGSPGTPDEDWWLPPEERESIETRPGDRPPEIGDDG